MTAQSFQLVMRAGPAPGKNFALSKEEIYIGRDIGNDIVINDAEVSRKHARLLLQAGQYVLEDLGSTNGSFVNDRRITGPHILTTGEVVQLGENVLLAFEASQYDPDATVAVSPEKMAAEAVEADAAEPEVVADVLSDEEAPYPAHDPSETFQEESPFHMPEEAPALVQEDAADNRRRWVLAGCGCLLLGACFLAAGFAAYYAWTTTGF